jgi:amino acid permease
VKVRSAAELASYPLPAGLVGALLLFAAVASLESFTMYVLAKYAERYDASSYGSLIRRALGRKSGAGLSAVTVLYLWGSSVAYLVSSVRRGSGLGFLVVEEVEVVVVVMCLCTVAATSVSTPTLSACQRTIFVHLSMLANHIKSLPI